MTPLEAEALLIRYQAILPYLERCEEVGRWALLAEVIDPTPEAERASIEVAMERGVSRLALAMAATCKQLVHDSHRVAAGEAVPAAA